MTDNESLVIPAGPCGCKVCCIVTSPFVLLLVGVIAVSSFGTLMPYLTSPLPEHNQTVNFDITYSPFLDVVPFLFENIMVEVYGASDGFPYELTICQPECPLMTQTDFLTVTGDCWNGRSTINCYARVNRYSSMVTEAQFISTYMLRNSMVTFRINAPNVVPEPVHLCITNTSNKCTQVFSDQSGNLTRTALNQPCYEVLSCDETNNYTQTFVAHDDGYYCAVWLLNSKDQQIHYTTNSVIQKYNITGFNSSKSKCEMYNVNGQSYKTNYDLVGSPMQNLCPVIQLKRRQENSNFGMSMIIKTTAVKRLSDPASIALIGVCGVVIIITIILAILCIIVCCRVCGCRS